MAAVLDSRSSSSSLSSVVVNFTVCPVVIVEACSNYFRFVRHATFPTVEDDAGLDTSKFAADITTATVIEAFAFAFQKFRKFGCLVSRWSSNTCSNNSNKWVSVPIDFVWEVAVNWIRPRNTHTQVIFLFTFLMQTDMWVSSPCNRGEEEPHRLPPISNKIFEGPAGSLSFLSFFLKPSCSVDSTD